MPPPPGRPLPSLHKSWPSSNVVTALSDTSPSVFAPDPKRWHTVYPRGPTRPISPKRAGNPRRLRGTFQTLCGPRPFYSAADKPSPYRRALLDFPERFLPVGDKHLL